MSRPVDYQVRERALDTRKSFIVQAPAGSGKTELLIRRFLNLLGEVEAPEEVVAITFTKKAAAEMRERVLSALALGQQPKPLNADEQVSWQLAHRAWINNQERGWQLHRHPTRLRIQTIDALCAALTRQMPWLSGFGAPLQVVEDASALYRAAAQDTLRLLGSKNDEWRSAVFSLLRHLDNQIPRAVELLTETLQYRDQWLRHLSQNNDSLEVKRRALESAWLSVIEVELKSAMTVVPPSIREDLVQCAQYAANQLTAKGKENDINIWRDRSGFVTEKPQDLSHWRGLCQLLLRQDGHWRQQVNVSIGFPANKLPQAIEMKKRMHGLLESISGHDALREALVRVRYLPGLKFQDRQWEVLEALTRLLPLAAARLYLIFKEYGQVDFSEINLRANQALGSLDSPSDLALRLDCQISHLLVDEFQDTSLIQFKLLENLTAGWSEDDERTIFLVGDPMQSIYRFREAEVGLFLRVQQRGIGMLKPEPLTLSVNFRSDPEVVSWVNEIFSQTFPVHSEIARGAVSFSASDAFIPPVRDAGVNIHGFVDTPDNTEAKQVIKIIEQTWKRDKRQTIAVLVRSRIALLDLLPALDRAGMSYSGVDIEGLDWQPVVQDLLSLTNALLFPADRMAWLAILRAPWCGLTLSDLHALAASDRRMCIWDNIRAAQENVDARNSLSTDGWQRLQRVAQTLDAALTNRGRVSVRRWIENVWIELGGAACITEHEQHNARVYFDLLEDFDRYMSMEDFTGFQRLVAQRWAQPENSADDRLQIMTLHKAKGLEFDTVIIPGLHRRLRIDESKLLLWEEQIAKGGGALLLAPLAQNGPARDRHYDYLRRLHGDKENFETLRLLYVGCTRARRCLHLLGTLNAGRDGNVQNPVRQSLLAKLWPHVKEEFKYVKAPQLELFNDDDADATPLMLKRLPKHWQSPVFPEPVPVTDALALTKSDAAVEFSWAGETARHVGVVVHNMLELIADDGLFRWNEQRINNLVPHWRSDYIRLGITNEDLDTAVTRTQHALLNVLNDERAHWLFDQKWLDAENEFAVSVSHKQSVRHLRIDRTFIDENGVRWIVDFKTSTHEGGNLDEFLDRERQRYHSQLESYAEAMRVIDPRPIRLGLYFPLLNGWREWDADV